MSIIKQDKSYISWLGDIKYRVLQSRIKASVKVNEELLRLYWSIGKEIILKSKSTNWGDLLIPQLSIDLTNEFPNIKGFSPTNLKYMRSFYTFYNQDTAISQQLVDQLQPDTLFKIPWGHHTIEEIENELKN